MIVLPLAVRRLRFPYMKRWNKTSTILYFLVCLYLFNLYPTLVILLWLESAVALQEPDSRFWSLAFWEDVNPNSDREVWKVEDWRMSFGHRFSDTPPKTCVFYSSKFNTMVYHLLAKQVLKIVSRIDVFQGPSWERCKILFHQKHLCWKETKKHGSSFLANNFVPRMPSKIFINWISPAVESLGLVLLLLACVMIANGTWDRRFRTIPR